MSRSMVRRPVRRRRRGGGVRLVARLVSGRSLDGRRYSNATFWRPGNRRVGYPPYLFTWDWWTLAAGWQRAALRLTGLLLAAGVLTAAVVHR